MGLRALVGVENAGGHYEARAVQLDGCPTLTVPLLSRLVHEVHGHDQRSAAERLLRHDWWRLYERPYPVNGGWVIGERSDHDGPPQQGHIDVDPAGDREWAYLFGGHRLHVYLGVPQPQGRPKWEPWACWSVAELPRLTRVDLRDVQQRDHWRRWRAADFNRYMAGVLDGRSQG